MMSDKKFMAKESSITVVIDTNLWISFLIGKRTANLIAILSRPNIALAMSDKAIRELKLVVSRDKFRKYFPESYSQKLFDFIEKRAETYNVVDAPNICRDPKDDYLLALSDKANADYLITGDNDLLVIGEYKGTAIVRLGDFLQLEK